MTVIAMTGEIGSLAADALAGLAKELDLAVGEGRASLIQRELTDAQWRRIEPLILGKEGDKGRHGEDNRLFVDAVLWLVRAGAPWRDMPPEFGNWNSVWKRYRRWAKRGVWKRVFDALNEDPEFEYPIIDPTIMRARQNAPGASFARLALRIATSIIPSSIPHGDARP
jgi:transposase